MIVHLLFTFNTVAGIIFYLWVKCFFLLAGGFYSFLFLPYFRSYCRWILPLGKIFLACRRVLWFAACALLLILLRVDFAFG